MKYRGKILIILCFAFAFLALSSANVIAQITVNTYELYSSDPEWVGPGDQDVGILRVTITNTDTDSAWLKVAIVSSECDSLNDVQLVKWYKDNDANTTFSAINDTLMGVGSFQIDGTCTFDWTNTIPADPLYLPPSTAVHFYVVFDVKDGVTTDSVGRILDVQIATDDIIAWERDPVPNGTDHTAPATPEGELRTYRILLDGWAPFFATNNIDLKTDSCAFKLHVDYACTVWNVWDNSTVAPACSADLQVLGGSAKQSLAYTALPPPDVNMYDFYGWIPMTGDSIPNGLDIPSNWTMPSGYVIAVTAYDQFGNSRTREMKRVYKYLDTIWPAVDSSKFTWELVYDAGSDGIASIDDSVKMTVNMSNQPPNGAYDEVLNVIYPPAPNNGVYIASQNDFLPYDVFNIIGVTLGYPLYFLDTDGNELWEYTFAVVSGDLDVDAYDATAICTLTTEDNIGMAPGCSPFRTGNLHRAMTSRAPYPIDNFRPVADGITYDLDVGGDDVCPGIVNIGDRVRMTINLTPTTDSLTRVSVDLLTSDLGGMANTPLYDDGTHGDDLAGDLTYTLEWTIPYPANGGGEYAAGTHSVTMTYCDDGGNCVDTVKVIDSNRPVDTEMPNPVENLTATAGPGGVIMLDWDDPSGTTDEFDYHIYSNGGSGGSANIDTTSEFGHSYDPVTDWTSEPLTHGSEYCFLLRVEDDACNMDTNFWMIACATADAEPPTASFINPLDGQTFCSFMQIVVQSPDADIDSFRLWYRQKDVDPGTAGDQPGPWTYGATVNNDGEFGKTMWFLPMGLTDGDYEALVCGIDLAGNEQDTTEAYTAGQSVYFIHDDTPPSVFINTINGEGPSNVILNNGNNTICVYAVDNLADSMLVRMEISENFFIKDTIDQGWVNKDDISPTNPYCFEFSLANWQTDSARLRVFVWDVNLFCWRGVAEITRPVQDVEPVVATMTSPVNYQRVFGSEYFPVQAEFLAGSPVDEVALVQFQERLHGGDTWSTFATIYTHFGNYFNAFWNNLGYDHGTQVDLRALFYDDAIPANVETTAFVTVTVDKEGPGIELVIENAQELEGIKYVAGDSLFLSAEVLDYQEVDIRFVNFYVKKTTQPDMYYQYIGSGNMENNYTIFHLRKYIASWDTAYYHVKAVGWDASWQDSAAAVDSFFYKGNYSAPQVAIYKIRTDTMEWVNPSKYLRYTQTTMDVYVQAWKQVTCWHLITTPGDSLQVDNVAYSWDGFNLGNYGLNDSVTFNPLEDGIINLNSLEGSGGSYYAKIHANLTDIFGNTTQDHSVGLYVLDVTGNQVVVLNPDNNEYKRDEIWLGAAAINAYNLRSVTYWYRALGATEWIKIATVTGSAPWSYTWYTRNNVADGWYEIMATSEDLAGNPSEPGPFQKFFIGNTPPVGWMVSPADSAFLGPNLDIRMGPMGDDFDTITSAYVRPKNPGGCPIDQVWFGFKPITSSSWTWNQWDDEITYYGDSLYGKVWSIRSSGPGSVTNGWYHVTAEFCDSCGNWSWASDTMSVYMDLRAPYGEVIGVNDNQTPVNMDLGGAPYEDTLKARAWDPTEDWGGTPYHKFASGLDSLQFMILQGECSQFMQSLTVGPPPMGSSDMVFFGSIFEPNDSTQYEMIWNSEGVDTGNYCFFCRAVDKVRNSWISDGLRLRIEDHTQRIATVRAFHNFSNRVYASVNMPGATSLTFQYYSLASSDWVNFGLAEMITNSGSGFSFPWGGSSYQTDTLWYTPWDPTSLPAGDYLVRCLAHGPWEESGGEGPPPPKAGLAKPVDASVGPVTRIHVDAEGNVTLAATADIGTISFEAIGGDSPFTSRTGVVKVEADAMPYLFAVYADRDSVIQGVRRIPVFKETGLDSYNSSFKIPSGIQYGGTARFFASLTPDTNWIEMGGFEISLVTKYLGTNGPVWFLDGTALINIPGHAVFEDSLCLVGYPTPMPPVVSNACKKYTAIGNGDGLLWNWVLFDRDCCFNDYFKITLYYDHTQVTVPESQLQVARWQYMNLCWDFSNVESPVVDEANHSITFWTNRLGTYAVVQTDVPMWASVTVDPYCGNYSNDMPCFISYIHSEYADIDVNSIKVKLGPVGGTMKTIYYDDTFADGYCSPFADWDYYEYEWQCYGSAWDPISGELDVCIMDSIKALAAGNYVIIVEAYDQVGNFATAVDSFTVDVKVPKITFLNGYVGKNPEFSFTIEDAESGVDTGSIYIDMYSVTKVQYEGNSWVENRRYLGTYTPPQIDIVAGVVDINTTLELVNNQAFDVVIYDGTYENGGAPAEQDEMRIYHPGHGPGDCVGNQTDPVYQRFAIDDQPPTFSMITSTSARPVKIMILDKESGVNWNSFKFFEDGTEIDPDTIDQVNGIVHYTPANIGVDVEISVMDNMDNLGYYNMTTEAEELAITGAHNYPNPFDNYTVIAFDLSRSADVVVKIYDFAGELVNTLIPGDYYNAGHVTRYWYGANDEGEDVANGIYLCHIKANDGSHTASEVIKIAVVRKD